MQKDITVIPESEKASMEEIGNRSGILEKYPPMSSPIVNKLGYNRMAAWADKILRG